MKAVVIILSIIAFVACLLIGMQVGSDSHTITDPTHPSAISSLPPAQQRTLLVIFADNIQSASPRLAGLWTVFYRPDVPRIEILPLYPVDASDDLANQFSLTSDHQPSPDFLKAIQNYHFRWDGYVLADPAAVAALVDEFKGISIKGKTLNGKAAAKTLKMPWDAREEALSSEKTFGEALCKLMAKQSTDANLKNLADGLPDKHVQIEFDLDQLSQDWIKLAGGQNHVECEFPTP